MNYAKMNNKDTKTKQKKTESAIKAGLARLEKTKCKSEAKRLQIQLRQCVEAGELANIVGSKASF